ncbi:MAG: YicC family protein [Prevotella sp.]|nr:YicC family protein [Prevotella sp.]
MILSMTGFGKSVVNYKNKKVHIEIKSLNSKSLDLSTRIAPLYRDKEIDIRQLLAQALERGKIDFSIWVENDEETNCVPVNAPLLETYFRQLQTIVRQAGMPEPSDWLGTLMRLPDVMSKTETEVLEDEEWAVVAEAIAEAVGQLTSFRRQEGAALQKKFEEKLDNIESLMRSIEPYEKSRIEKIRQRIVDNLRLIPEADYNENRLEQELIYYIEKLDISEEKQRLANHLAYFRQTMNEDGHGVGKKLGFIAQEMGREINTTGSKSNQAEMQNIVVMMKDELEQIKEQVLNTL